MAILLVLAAVPASGLRNAVYLTPLSLWTIGVPGPSSKARVHMNIGNSYRLFGRIDEAVAEYRTSVMLDRGYIAVYPNLFACCAQYEQNGRFPGAADCYRFFCLNAPPLFSRMGAHACARADQIEELARSRGRAPR